MFSFWCPGYIKNFRADQRKKVGLKIAEIIKVQKS